MIYAISNVKKKKYIVCAKTSPELANSLKSIYSWNLYNRNFLDIDD